MEKHFVPIGNVYYMHRKNKVLFSNILSYESFINSSVFERITNHNSENMIINENSKELFNGKRIIDNADITIDLKNEKALNINFFIFAGQERRKFNTSQTIDNSHIQYNTNSLPENYVLSGSVGYDSRYFKIRYGIVYNRANRNYDYANYYQAEDREENFILRKNIKNFQNSLKADYSRQFLQNKLSFSAGIKWNYNQLNNKDSYTPEIHPPINFNVNENIIGIYSDINYAFHPKFSMYGGIRVEETIYATDYNSNSHHNSYLDFMPSVSLDYTPIDKYKVSLVLNGVISRPEYESLTPGVIYQTDNEYFSGNPFLLPSKQYSLKLDNYFFEYFYLGISAKYIKDLSKDIMIEHANGVTESISKNVVDFRGLSFYCDLPFNLLKKKLYVKLSINYSFGKYFNPKNDYILLKDDVKHNGAAANVYLDYTIGRRFGINLYGSYGSKARNLQVELNDNYFFDAGCRLNLLKNYNLNLSFTAKDIFNTNKIYRINRYNNAIRTDNIRFNSQSFIFTVSYSFGRGTKINKEHKWDPNEKERIL